MYVFMCFHLPMYVCNKGLGKECVTVIRRVLEIVESRFTSLGIEEGDCYCAVHILASKLAMRNFSYFERVSSVMTLTGETTIFTIVHIMYV